MVVAARVTLLLMVLVSLSGCFSTSVHHTTHRTAASGSSKLLVYNVRANDTLYSIGKRFGVDYHTLASRNHLKAPYHIFVGQQLYINRKAPPLSGRSVARAISHVAVEKRLKVPVRSSKTKSGQVKKKRVARKSAKSSPHRKAASAAGAKLLWPVRGTVTSRFGRRGSRMHDGIDIGAKQGTAVHAAASGDVVYSDSRLSGYGKLIIIRHGHNLFTAYAHNQRNLVRKGSRVRSGDVIARVGQTGRASGPHLHFEVRQGSTPVDPLAYLPR